jgi:hypothetical protein
VCATVVQCLSDEFKAVLSVQEQVIAELFARLRSCQGYFFLGAGAAFSESQASEVRVFALRRINQPRVRSLVARRTGLCVCLYLLPSRSRSRSLVSLMLSP